MAASGKKNMFNEATRVQMPAMVHLTRLGYTYFGKITEDMAGTVYDPDTNILINVFKEQFARLNPTHTGEAEQTLKTIRQELDNDDIGRSFYERLSSVSPVRLVDFENPKNNTYHFTAEFTCKRDQDEFRPDITLFVNGLPLVFVEVKKPNNHGGMVAESKRMNQKRFPNKKFRRFLNITQLMIFSNNMEYDTMGGIVPVQGAFYCTTAKQSAPFNCFREENPTNLDIAPYNADFPYKDIDPIVEKKILTDFNCQVIHTSPEYQTNLDTYTPTNRVLTSMCSPERLLFILKYGIAYVRFHKEINGKIEFIEQKHIMRYQQMFAALTVRSKIDEGVNSGVIWHTQGSGKTALSYYLTYVLSDYFSKQNKVAKFYFIVDRLDLLKQASEEFEARGLVVKTASSRAELMEQFRNNQAQEGNTGKPEITVVNIQRFAEDRSKVDLPAYATNLQRVFIIDEAHRGYKPEGSFLANLLDADKNAIKIALTGTPLLKEERESWRVFGNYIHTYYYDKSILDGYTLKIIREDIETQYKERLSEIYEKLETLVEKKDVKKSQIVEHDNYVKELLRYIISDLKRFRQIQGDNTLGGMVICETSEQARKLFAYFDEIQAELNKDASMKSHLRAGLILHDSDDKDTRDKIAEGFLFSLMSKGNDFANQNYNALFSGPYVSAGGMSVTENNFEKAMIVHAVRRIPKASWLNDRDQFMQPKEDVINDNEFVTQCVIWGLFSDSNNTVSISNVKYKNVNYRVRNQLFPFGIERIRKWEIKNNDILNQLWGKHSDRFAAKWLVNRKITGDAMNVLESGEKIYKYFYAHLDEIAWPKYEIKNWDVGWWQVKMSLTDTGIGLELLSDLKEKMNQLEKCILDKIYQYEFLLPAIQEVNKES